MATHLSESEFVDVAEDRLDRRRGAQAGSCASCRQQADALRAMLRDTASVAVPEPSPLFWDHLTARVRDEVAAEAVPSRPGGIWSRLHGLMPLAAVAALVVAVISGVLLVRALPTGRLRSEPIARTVTAPVAPDRRPDATPDAKNAEVWAVLTAAASGAEFEDAHAARRHRPPAPLP